MARKKKSDKVTRRLLKDEEDLFDDSYQAELERDKNKPVECLGMEFPNDEARREYFLEKLREKLRDPGFRQIEGFPIGDDEDILALSDPPYYTACPNPFIAEFIKHYGKPYDPATDDYGCEPFAADVSKARPTGFTEHILTTPRCLTAPSCVIYSTTPILVISFSTVSPARE